MFIYSLTTGFRKNVTRPDLKKNHFLPLIESQKFDTMHRLSVVVETADNNICHLENIALSFLKSKGIQKVSTHTCC